MQKKICVVWAFVALWNVSASAQQAAPSRQEIETIVGDYIKSHPDEVADVVKNYIVKHPEILREVFSAIVADRKRQSRDGADAQSFNASEKLARERAEAVAANAMLLFNSPRQTSLGDAAGDTTMVEFFDYNCGFCKRAVADTAALLAEDTRLKIALKEFPVLGPDSADAARVSIAVHMQDPGGQKFLAFHKQMLGSREAANFQRALAVAGELGLDRSRLERDADSDEARATLAENARLASTLKITGTPAYVIGNSVFFGAIGKLALKERIEALRKTP